MGAISGTGPQEVHGLVISCAFFLGTHLSSFIFYRKREEAEGITPPEIAWRMIERIYPMHIPIIAGSSLFFPAFYIGQDAGQVILLIFLLLKTVADLRSHVPQYRMPAQDVTGQEELRQKNIQDTRENTTGFQRNILYCT